MTHLRSVSTVAATACLALGMSAASAASPEPGRTIRRGDLTFTSATHTGESVLAVEAAGIRVEKRAAATGTGTIVLTAGGDRVEVTVTGRALRVSHGGQTRVVAADQATAADFEAIRAMLRQAPAVEATARLQALVQEDAPAPLVSALAFVRMLAGDASGMRRVAAHAPPSRPGIQFARDAVACWSSYQTSINIFFLDFESCIYDNRWNIIVQHGCSFVYVVQAEVAWFSLIACAGGLPGL